MFIRPYTSQQPVDDFGLMFSDLKYSGLLETTTDTLFTVPANAKRYKMVVKVGPAVEVWVAYNAVALAPVAQFTPTSSELVSGSINLCREVVAGDIIHFFTTSTDPVPVSIVLYSTD